MKRRKLGCLTTGGLVAVLLSLIVIGSSYAVTRNKMFSPGPLNAQRGGRNLGEASSHADVELECAACHPAPWDREDMADLCLDCHQDVIEQLADLSSLHGATMSNMNDHDCRVCHTDHNGETASMTEYLDGDFPHELVGFALTGHQHLDWSREVVCADCHQAGFSEFDLLVCANCHEQVDADFVDAHTSLFGPACLDCHDGIDSYGKDFDHDDLTFPLEGEHAKLGCEGCHPGAVSLAMLQETPQNCESCHLEEDAHKGSLGTRCGVCHTPEGWKPALFDHGKTGFELIGGHAGLDCGRCHADTTYKDADSSCYSCHAEDDEHQGQFGTVCALCHSVYGWEDVHFDHSGDYAQDCQSCHQSDSPANHYPGQCSACHTTDGWLPASFDHAVAGATDCLSCHSGDRPANHFTGQCSVCHSTSAWKPASFSHTFPLNHGGAGEQCTLCHTTSNYNVYTCYGCHEHSEANIRSEHEGISNLNNCVRCHWDGREHDEDGGGGGGNNNDDNNDDDD
jgi:hypothetical protein